MCFKSFLKLGTGLTLLVFLCGCETFFKKEPTYLVRKQLEEDGGAYVLANPRTTLVGGHKIEIRKEVANQFVVVPDKPKVISPSDSELVDTLEARRQSEKMLIVPYSCGMEGCHNQSVHMHYNQIPVAAGNLSDPVINTEDIKTDNKQSFQQMSKQIVAKAQPSSQKLWNSEKNNMMKEIESLKRKIDSKILKDSDSIDLTRKTYVVKEGDSLWDIAGSELGDNYRWIEIYSENRDVLPNPNQLYPGLTLILPEDNKEKTI